MQFSIPSIHYKRLALVWVILIIVTALSASLFVHIPTTGKTVADASDVWKLPIIPQNDITQVAPAKLRQLRPWKVAEAVPKELDRKKKLEEQRQKQAQMEQERLQREQERKKQEEEEKARFAELQRQLAEQEQSRLQQLAERQRLEQEKLEQERLAKEKKEKQDKLKKNFVGTIQQGNQWLILLVDDTGKVKEYPVGSALPTYDVSLTAVHIDFIEVLRGKETEKVYLYR